MATQAANITGKVLELAATLLTYTGTRDAYVSDEWSFKYSTILINSNNYNSFFCKIPLKFKQAHISPPI